MPLVGTWVLIMLAYAVRRLPYALRACMAALQQVHVVAGGGGAEPRRLAPVDGAARRRCR
ncbi:MAG: hypothetical protein QM777_10725 [Pseudorhodoferax sp.]